MSINFRLTNEYDQFFNRNRRDGYSVEKNDQADTVTSSGSTTIKNAVNKFEQGNMTVEELLETLQANGIAYTATKTTDTHEVIMFELEGKKYAIACNRAASASSSDTKKAMTYAQDVLQKTYKFDSDAIKTYFDEVEVVDGKVLKYALKADCGYTSAAGLRNALYNEAKNAAVLNNFVNNDMNKKTNSAADLGKFNGKSITLSNLRTYRKDIMAATGGDVDGLRQEALDKFVKEFASGDIAYAQVDTILKAIGVSNTQKKVQNGNYVVTFEFNDKKYTVTCNEKAAARGTDNVRDENGSYKETVCNKDGTSSVTTYNSQGEVQSVKNYGADGKLVMSKEDRALVDNYKSMLILNRYYGTIGEGEFRDAYENGEGFAMIDGRNLEDDELLELIQSGKAPGVKDFAATEQDVQNVINKFILDIQENNFYDSTQLDEVVEALKQLGVENVKISQAYPGEVGSVSFDFGGKNYQVSNLNVGGDFDLNYKGEVLSRDELKKVISENPEEAYYYQACTTVDGKATQYIRCLEKNDTPIKMAPENKVTYYPDGKVRSTTIYNDNGNPEREEVYSSNGNLSSVKTYNTAGKLERQESYFSYGKQVRIYNAAGNVEREESYNKNGNITGAKICTKITVPMNVEENGSIITKDVEQTIVRHETYNNDGKTISVRISGGDEVLARTVSIRYDEDGKLVRIEYPSRFLDIGIHILDVVFEELVDPSKTKVDGNVTQYYASNGTLLYEDIRNSDGKVYRNIFGYHENGQLASSQHYCCSPDYHREYIEYYDKDGKYMFASSSSY